MGKFRRGQIFNLNRQDFTGLVALATSPAGELFFGGVMTGIISRMQYEVEGATIHLGIIASEIDGQVKLQQAISVEPKRLLIAHQATNFSPRDCLRGLWFDITQLRPDFLTDIMVPSREIVKRFNLEGGAPNTIA